MMNSKNDSMAGNRTFTEDGLIVPRKITNPYVGSREKKDLHKEMLWKLKYGGDDPKSCEYQKAFNSFQNRQRLKAIEVESSGQSTFEKLLEEQRQRLNQVGSTQAVTNAATAASTESSTPFPNNLHHHNQNQNHSPFHHPVSSESHPLDHTHLHQLHPHQTNTNNNQNQNHTSSTLANSSESTKSVPHRDEFHRVFNKVRSKSSTLSGNNNSNGTDSTR